MGVITLNNLQEILSTMKVSFGGKELASEHRSVIDTYALNVDCTDLEFGTDVIVTEGASSSVLGTGKLGVILLGTS